MPFTASLALVEKKGVSSLSRGGLPFSGVPVRVAVSAWLQCMRMWLRAAWCREPWLPNVQGLPKEGGKGWTGSDQVQKHMLKEAPGS